MNKVVATYWDNHQTVLTPAANSRPRAEAKREKTNSHWFVFSVVVFITFMLCLTVNLRAFTELGGEIEQHHTLTLEVEQLTSHNLAIQEEIHRLKTDPRSVESEARKLGMGRANERILVSGN